MDIQKQAAGDGAVAIMAGGNVTLGLSVAEVRELCTLYLQQNFPALREEARKTAEENVQRFALTFGERIQRDITSVVADKFRDPDVQAAINDAVMATARKGERATPEILSELITQRVRSTGTPFTDIVLSEAVQVVPKLTSDQIAFLAFHQFALKVKFSDVQMVEAVSTVMYPFLSPGFNLSDGNRNHLAYAGACTLHNFAGGDAFEIAGNETYAASGLKGEDFKKYLATSAPTYARLLDQFNKDALFKVQLSSVGQAIALAHLSKQLGTLDYRIWIN